MGDEGRQQQSVDVQALAVGSEENIDEIRFENDMIKFIFLFFPGMQDYYHNTKARQYFSPFFFFFFFKTDRTPGIIFQFIRHLIPTCL